MLLEKEDVWVYSYIDHLFHNANVVGLIGLLFFGYIFIYNIIIITKKELIHSIVNANGITDYSSNVKAGFIPWNEIKRINYNGAFLTIEVTDGKKYRKGFSQLLYTAIGSKNTIWMTFNNCEGDTQLFFQTLNKYIELYGINK